MVQETGNSLKRISVLAALMLVAGAAQADVITGAGPGAGPDRTVKSGGKGTQKGGVSVAAGDVTGDGRTAKPVTPIAPIKASPTGPKPVPRPPANIQAQPQKPAPLLVPAVQKVRESAGRSK